MTTAIFDAASVLIPTGLNNSSQSFSALAVEARLLPTTAWMLHVSVPQRYGLWRAIARSLL